MKYYAVFDTNVLVSSLLTKNPDSATARVIDLVADGKVTSLFNGEILDEYEEVLSRAKFRFSHTAVERLMEVFRQFGQALAPIATDEPFAADSDDKIFYEVVMAKREQTNIDEDSYLVTGNLRHFLIKPFVVTPAEMLAIVEG